MQWTFEDYKHDHFERQQTADRHRLAHDARKDITPLRRGVQQTRRNRHHRDAAI